MNKLMKGIGAFILACIVFAIPILTPISIMLGWRHGVSGLLCLITGCELMYVFTYLYFYGEVQEQ